MKKLYQPLYYFDDGTNIEYGNLPDKLDRFQFFETKKACRDWLSENGYNPADFIIYGYDEDDIEKYEIIGDRLI